MTKESLMSDVKLLFAGYGVNVTCDRCPYSGAAIILLLTLRILSQDKYGLMK